MKFSNNFAKLKIVRIAKIRPIWSHRIHMLFGKFLRHVKYFSKAMIKITSSSFHKSTYRIKLMWSTTELYLLNPKWTQKSVHANSTMYLPTEENGSNIFFLDFLTHFCRMLISVWIRCKWKENSMAKIRDQSWLWKCWIKQKYIFNCAPVFTLLRENPTQNTKPTQPHPPKNIFKQCT
jgi:hypothetical protein